MTKQKKSHKNHLRILLHIGRFFWVLAIFSCIVGPLMPKIRIFIDDMIGENVTCNLPAHEENVGTSDVAKSSAEAEAQEDIVDNHTPRWGLFAAMSALLGTVFLVLYYMSNILKKLFTGNKREETGVTSSEVPPFDPSNLYSTTTPLSEGQYGTSAEVSVTSPLNQGFYFEVIDEYKYLGSDEVI